MGFNHRRALAVQYSGTIFVRKPAAGPHQATGDSGGPYFRRAWSRSMPTIAGYVALDRQGVILVIGPPTVGFRPLQERIPLTPRNGQPHRLHGNRRDGRTSSRTGRERFRAIGNARGRPGPPEKAGARGPTRDQEGNWRPQTAVQHPQGCNTRASGGGGSPLPRACRAAAGRDAPRPPTRAPEPLRVCLMTPYSNRLLFFR